MYVLGSRQTAMLCGCCSLFCSTKPSASDDQPSTISLQPLSISSNYSSLIGVSRETQIPTNKPQVGWNVTNATDSCHPDLGDPLSISRVRTQLESVSGWNLHWIYHWIRQLSVCNGQLMNAAPTFPSFSLHFSSSSVSFKTFLSKRPLKRLFGSFQCPLCFRDGKESEESWQTTSFLCKSLTLLFSLRTKAHLLCQFCYIWINQLLLLLLLLLKLTGLYITSNHKNKHLNGRFVESGFLFVVSCCATKFPNQMVIFNSHANVWWIWVNKFGQRFV